MHVGNCTLVLSLLSRLDEVYFDRYGSITARFADMQSLSEVNDTPAVIFSINKYLSGWNCCQVGQHCCQVGQHWICCQLL